MSPSEVDTASDIASGQVPGIKHAALRKLEHELGIPKEQLSLHAFKFLTRLHYWAADTLTHGPKSPWGEHEIDYVLFLTVPSKESLTLRPNPEEVMNVRWVTPSQLEDMLQDKTLRFSPWFRIIVSRWLMEDWWKDLKMTMTTDVYCDYQKIHCFDPPVEHMGGLGAAKSMFPSLLQGDVG